MAATKTESDFIVHERPNGDLWLFRRGGSPAFKMFHGSRRAKKSAADEPMGKRAAKPTAGAKTSAAKPIAKKAAKPMAGAKKTAAARPAAKKTAKPTATKKTAAAKKAAR